MVLGDKKRLKDTVLGCLHKRPVAHPELQRLRTHNLKTWLHSLREKKWQCRNFKFNFLGEAGKKRVIWVTHLTLEI